MESAKIRLSREEQALIKNEGVILTKNSALKKINELLAALQTMQAAVLPIYAETIPRAALANSPKLSRGENYNGLPWLMLDYPRLFEKEDVFALRTMFWWGKFFSTTLHLSGKSKMQYHDLLIERLPGVANVRLNFSSEWDHDAEGVMYVDAGVIKHKAAAIRESGFIKMTHIRPIENLDDLPEMLMGDYQELLRIIGR